MSGIAVLRSSHKLLNRLSRISLTTQVNVKQSINRPISTTKVYNFNVFPANQNKTCSEEITPKKNWVNFGFSVVSEEHDKWYMHITIFTMISVGITFGIYFATYRPDFQMNDWIQREAYLELRRRECLGLPAIDPNLIDPKKVHLPTEEELEGVEIII